MENLKIKKGKNGQYFIYLPTDYMKNNNIKNLVIVKINEYRFIRKIVITEHKNVINDSSCICAVVTLPKLMGELLFQNDNEIEVINYEEVSNS